MKNHSMYDYYFSKIDKTQIVKNEPTKTKKVDSFHKKLIKPNSWVYFVRLTDEEFLSLSKYESAYLEILEKNYQKALEKISDLDSIEHSYKERSLILKGEIYDYGLNDKSMAVDTYLNFIDLYPKSIFYDIIRLRLRELAL